MGGDPIDAQARRLNHILRCGRAGEALIRSHLATGAEIDGNPVWVFDLEITPHNGPSYDVEHEEIVSAAATGAYPRGARLACRIDPDDPERIAFGSRPFM